MIALLKKSGSLVTIILSLFILIALLDYQAEDPSLFHATDKASTNIAGSFGSTIADPLLQAFGYALIMPLGFFIYFALREMQSKENKYLAFKIITLLVILPFIALFLSELDSNHLGDGNYYSFNWGGYLGYFCRSELSYTNFEGRLLFSFGLVTFFLLAFVSGLLEKVIARRNNSLVETPRREDEKAPDNPITEQKLIFPFMKEKEKSKLDIELFTVEKKEINHNFPLPPVELLHSEEYELEVLSELEESDNKNQLLKVLNDFGIRGEIIDLFHGPVVTLYALEPVPGTKSSRVIGLADDIARSMKAASARISILQGRNAIGIEIPNKIRLPINFKDIIASNTFQKSDAQLPLALGTTITGERVVVDLAKMPHLLVAGTTGSGKSVGLHAMILSLLYKYGPDSCKFLLIDPKRLEFSIYSELPHLVTPLVTEPDKAIASLQWIVEEMGVRYRAMSLLGVRNIFSYNKIIEEGQKDPSKLHKEVQTGFDPISKEPIFESILINKEKLPYIVVIIDEMADLMLVSGKEIEGSVQRLAQMARAAGIHLIMSTQRPSVDVITGVIKANLPTRISFQVASKIDSRTILGEMGAEQLLGAGDLLYMMPGGKIERLHGAMVEDEDISAIVNYWKEKFKSKYLFIN